MRVRALWGLIGVVDTLAATAGGACAGRLDLLIGGDSGGPWLDSRGQMGAVNSQVSGDTLAGVLLDAQARPYYRLAMG
jgi:hypothetical protein